MTMFSLQESKSRPWRSRKEIRTQERKSHKYGGLLSRLTRKEIKKKGNHMKGKSHTIKEIKKGNPHYSIDVDGIKS
uniref:Uncharacterized protein n=1 Tax=Arundo donax TaxID=35708 RepID=A0A0A9HWB9_ARUDO